MARANNYEDPRSKRKYYKTVKDGKTQYSRQVRIGTKKLWTPFFPSTKKVEEYIIQESSKKEESIDEPIQVTDKHTFIDVYKHAFSNMQKEYIAEGRSPKTLQKFKGVIKKYVIDDEKKICTFKDKFIEDITVIEVMDFKKNINDAYSKQLSENTISAAFVNIDRVFSYARYCGYISKAFTDELDIRPKGKKQISRTAVRNFFSEKEMQKFLDVYDENSLEYFSNCLKMSLRTKKLPAQSNLKLIAEFRQVLFRTLFMFIFYTGTRKSEARGARWECIIEPRDELDIYSISVEHQYAEESAHLIGKEVFEDKTKSDSSARIIYIHDKLSEQLLVLYDFLKTNALLTSKYIFYDPFCLTPKPIPRNNINRVFDYFKDLTDIEKNSPIINGVKRHITIHGMRHSACTMLLEKGMSKEDVAKFLGHKDTYMVDYVYNHYIDPIDMELEAKKRNLQFFKC